MDGYSYLIAVAAIVFAVFVAITIVWFAITRLFLKTTKNVAFVRTGIGKTRVCKDGAILVISSLHNVTKVNLELMKLPVERQGADSLQTKDRVRTDIKCTFFTNVKNQEDDIALAANKFNDKTMDARTLLAEIQDQFVDAIRATALTKEFKDILENRKGFADEIKTSVTPIIARSGLEITDVAITHLQMTDLKYYNDNDINDAEGRKNITISVTANNELRNEVEQASRVRIEQRNYEANLTSLEIARNDEQATLNQQREIENARISQEADLAKLRASRKQETDIATIQAEQQTEEQRIAAERLIEEQRITTKQSIDLSTQASRIAIAQKSEEESKALALAADAKATAILAEEKSKTLSAVEIANRTKEVARIAAEQKAVEESTHITVMAKAEFDASELRKKARMNEAEAQEREYSVRADGETKLAEAANKLSPAQVELKVKLAAIEKAPEIVREQVKPMSNIKDAKVISFSGLGGNGDGIMNTVNGNGSTGDVGIDLANALTRHKVSSKIADVVVGGMAGFDVGSLGDKLYDNILATEPKKLELPSAEKHIVEPIDNRNSASNDTSKTRGKMAQ